MISAIQKILELLIVKDQQNSPTVTVFQIYFHIIVTLIWPAALSTFTGIIILKYEIYFVRVGGALILVQITALLLDLNI